MKIKADTSWLTYQANFKIVTKALSKEKLDDLGLIVARLEDQMPFIAALYQVFRRARLDLAKHLSTNRGDKEEEWVNKYLEFTMVNSRLEGALTAFMTALEVPVEDVAGALKIRLQSVIELTNHAFNQGLIQFPKPQDFSIESLMSLLQGKPLEPIKKKPRIIQIPKSKKSSKKR